MMAFEMDRSRMISMCFWDVEDGLCATFGSSAVTMGDDQFFSEWHSRR